MKQCPECGSVDIWENLGFPYCADCGWTGNSEDELMEVNDEEMS
ncbi:MAG: hypothetical protein V1897_02295 [Pseudomonadota bacterium]